MNELCGIFFEQGHEFLNLMDSSQNKSEFNPIFTGAYKREYLEHDTYMMFDLLMRSGVYEFYVHLEPGRKKPKTEKMFGLVDFSSNNVSY